VLIFADSASILTEGINMDALRPVLWSTDARYARERLEKILWPRNERMGSSSNRRDFRVPEATWLAEKKGGPVLTTYCMIFLTNHPLHSAFATKIAAREHSYASLAAI